MHIDGSEGFRRYMADQGLPRIDTATRFVVDSEFEGYARILESHLLRQVGPSPSLEALTAWELWSLEEESVLPKPQAASLVGVEPTVLQEGRVFIRVGARTFEATGLVRTRVKETYKRLLAREANLARLRERR